jgi:Gamma-glutamyl cyclotransferase, AIG2-like
MRFFFYGTLLDPELRRVVIGRDTPVTAAMLLGWRRLGVAGEHFPMIRRDATGSVVGAVTDPLGMREVARLRHYEGDIYRVVAVEVCHEGGAAIAAAVFAPPDGHHIGAGTWSLGDWQRDHRAAILDRLRAHDWPHS